jgi:hypothetical protein
MRLLHLKPMKATETVLLVVLRGFLRAPRASNLLELFLHLILWAARPDVALYATPPSGPLGD